MSASLLVPLSSNMPKGLIFLLSNLSESLVLSLANLTRLWCCFIVKSSFFVNSVKMIDISFVKSDCKFGGSFF